MNAVAMVDHSLFHQREVIRRAVCPIQGDVMEWEGSGWVCPVHATVTQPVWSETDGVPCPYPELHG